MKKCDYCGEYKKVRRNLNGSMHLKKTYPMYFYNNICEDCNIAKKIIEKEETEKRKNDESKRQKNWIKERNKILENLEEIK